MSTETKTPQHIEPEQHLGDIAWNLNNHIIGSDDAHGERHNWQGIVTETVWSSADGATKLETKTNHHGGHQTVRASAVKLNPAGQITTYEASVPTLSWGREDPYPGTLKVRRYDASGKEIYSHTSKRHGAAENFAKLIARQIERNS